MAFTGDMLIHQGVRNEAARLGEVVGRDYYFRPFLGPIEPVISGVDWAVCHMEVNLSADGTRLSGFPLFRAPGQLAFDLADVGYDACSTGSNHAVDHGFDGVVETIAVLDDAGLAHTGTAATDPGDAWGTIVEIDGALVAHLSYTYSTNGLPVPAEAPWAVALIAEERILADAAAARQAGADLVVISLHWGNEYQHTLSTQQDELGDVLIASPDIDLIVGHHAHVIQPIEKIGGEWIVYGLGNLLSNQTQLERRDELAVIARVEEQPGGGFAVARLSAIPLYLEPTTHTVYPSGRSLRPSDTPAALATDLDASWARVAAVLEGSPVDVLG
jgi:poly-gamma-glutamate synthesis protein (capsule biosynthesis protein)